MTVFSKKHAGLILLLIVLVLLPLVIPNSFYLDLVIRMAINAIIVLGLNLLIGYAGQISLGHAGFVGLGAFASAILPNHFGWPTFAALLAGAFGTGLIALLIARPIFKLKGHFLAMATLGLGIIINIVLRNEAQYTGGPDGMSVMPLSLFGIDIVNEYAWYWIVAVLLCISVWASLNLIDSPFGRALRALHGSEMAAQVVGVNVARYKVIIFVMSAVFASLMGSITAHHIGFITPSVADFPHSIELLTMVVVGGVASVYGSLVGAILLTLLPQVLANFEGWETVVYGCILVGCMIFVPKGIVPTLAARFGKGG